MAGYKRKNDVDLLMNIGYKFSELEKMSDEKLMTLVEKFREVKTVISENEKNRFADSFTLLHFVVGTSLADIEKSTGILSMNLSRYERGMFEPILSVAQLIAKYFHTTVGEMINFNYCLEKLIKIKEAFCVKYGKPVEFFSLNKKAPKELNMSFVVGLIENETKSFEIDLDRLIRQYLIFTEFITWRNLDKFTDILSKEFLSNFK